MNQLFWHQIGTYMLIYLDDIICIPESPDQHLKHLQTIFEKNFEARIQDCIRKRCNFFQNEVKYLGFIFNSDGVKNDPQKTTIIRNDPTPTKVKDVRAFLGMINFFRRYIKTMQICVTHCTVYFKKMYQFYGLTKKNNRLSL